MLVRIVLLVVLGIILFWPLLRRYWPIVRAKAGYYIQLAGWFFLAAMLLLLVASGRLNWLFALAGVAFTLMLRLLPVLMRYAPDLHRLFLMWRYHRNNQQSRDQHRQSGTTDKTVMSRAEAFEVLGLQPGAAREEIIAAHKRLIQKLHPDRGGSDYLASRINLAKQTLLKS